MKKLVFVFLLSLPGSVFAQMEKADSLVKILETRKLDAIEQLHLYDSICRYYRRGDIEKLLEFAHKGSDLAKKQKDRSWQATFHEYLGTGYSILGEYETSFGYWDRILEYAHSVGDRDLEAYAYGCIGSNYGRSEDNVNAQEYYLKALKLYEEIGNNRQCMRLQTVIGAMYRGMGMNDQALPHLLKATAYAKEMNDTVSIGETNYEMAIIYLYTQEYDKVLEHAGVALEMAEAIHDTSGISLNMSTIAMTYSHLGRFEEALQYAEKAVEIVRHSGYKKAIADALVCLSNVHRDMGNWEECGLTAEESWMVDTTNVNLGLTSTYNMTMSNIYLQRTEKAIRSLQRHYGVVQRYIDAQAHANIIDLEYKYEAEKKEMRIAALEYDKKLYFLLGVAVLIVLLLVTGLLVFMHRLNMQKRKLAEQQIKQLERDNQLIATQSLLDGETTERSRIARELHDGLGGMLSALKLNLGDIGSYEKMEKADIERFVASLSLIGESASELRRIVHNMMPESLVMDGLNVALTDFCRSIPVVNFRYIGNGERLGSHLELAVYRIAQELVNNALKHADASRINVQLLVNDGVVSLTVIDDGKGFDPDQVAKGAGLKNIRTRVQAFNGHVSVLSKPGSGTEIIIEIDRQL